MNEMLKETNRICKFHNYRQNQEKILDYVGLQTTILSFLDSSWKQKNNSKYYKCMLGFINSKTIKLIATESNWLKISQLQRFFLAVEPQETKTITLQSQKERNEPHM